MEISNKKVVNISKKDKYIKKCIELHYKKTGKNLSHDDALEYFEKLIVLVETIISNN